MAAETGTRGSAYGDGGYPCAAPDARADAMGDSFLGVLVGAAVVLTFLWWANGQGQGKGKG